MCTLATEGAYQIQCMVYNGYLSVDGHVAFYRIVAIQSLPVVPSMVVLSLAPNVYFGYSRFLVDSINGI